MMKNRSVALLVVLVLATVFLAPAAHAQVAITITSPADYVEGTLELSPATRPYMDRAYLYTDAPTAFVGQQSIRTANRDRYEDSEDYMVFEVDRPVTITVLYSAEAATEANWLANNFIRTGEQISRNYHTWNVWQQDFAAGTIILGGNLAQGAAPVAGGSIAMFTVLVAEASEAPSNRPPSIYSDPVTSVLEGLPYAYDVQASDPDPGDALSYLLETAPPAMTIDSASGLIEWLPGAGEIGNHPVSVRVEDSQAAADSQSFTVTVSPNIPPEGLVITVISPADYLVDTLEISPATRPYIDRSYLFNAAPEAYLGLMAVQTANRDRYEDSSDYLQFEISHGAIVYVLYSSEAASVPEWLSSQFSQTGEQISRNYHVWNVWERRYSPGVVVLGGNTALPAAPVAGGALGMYSVLVEQAAGPAADFSATPLSGHLPLEVAFTDLSDGEITSWSWSFGDGEMSTEQHPAHTYASAGSYAVSLEVTTATGADSLARADYITVSDPAVNQTPSIVSTPTTEATVDSAYSYDVDASDPNAGDLLTYSLDTSPVGMSIDPASGLIGWTPGASQVGEHPVTVRVADQDGAADTQTFAITVDDGSAPVELEITVISPADYAEGTLAISPASRPYIDRSYVFTAAPERYLGLPTVRTANADRSEDSADYLVFEVNKPVNVYVCYSTEAATVPQWLSSNFLQTGDQVSRNYHTWNVWQRRYPAGQVVLGGNDALGASPVPGGSIAMFVVLVEEASGATADFSASPLAGNLPLEVSFTDESTGPVDTWSWSFGDGELSTEQNPVHTFATAGSYTVTLEVSGAEGSHHRTEVELITVVDPAANQPPTITSTPVTSVIVDQAYAYDVEADDPDAVDLLTFSLDSAPVGMSIDPANGLIDWIPNLTDLGSHQAIVRVEDQDGAADTQVFTITVSDGSEPVPLEITNLVPADYAETTLKLAPGAAMTYVDRSYVFAAAPQRLVEMRALQTANRDRYETSDDYFHFDVNQAVNVYVCYSTEAATVPDWLARDFAQTGEQVSRTYHTWNVWHRRFPAGTVTLGGNEAAGSANVPGGFIGMYVVLIETAGGPQAEFSADPLSGSFPLEVSFTDESDGEITAWAWDFGDGETSSAASPAHTFAAVGEYSVSLEVTAPDGTNSTTKPGYIRVTDPANNSAPAIDSTPVTSAVAGELYTYDANASDANGDTLSWSLDTAPAGMTIVSATGVAEWRPEAGQIGDHPVVVRVEDPLAAADIQSFTVTVSQAPTVDELVITILTPADYQQTTLEVEPATQSYMDRAYPFTAAPNAYIGLPVIQTANRDRYESSEDYMTFEVNKPVWVYVLYSTEAATAPDWLENSFSRTGEQVSRRYHSWNVWKRQFPAGVVTLGGNEAPGLIEQEGGSAGMFTVVVEPLESPFAEFEAVPVAGAPPLEVQFTDRSTGGVNNWLWNFGDGQTSTEQNPVHAYTGLGVYTVLLDVSGYAGSDSRTRTAYINVTFDEVNQAPQITSSPVTEAIADELYNYSVQATDPNAADALTYLLDNAPAGMTIDPDTGVVDWSPTSDQVGSHEITVRVEDQAGLFDTQPYTLLVDVARMPWLHAYWDYRQAVTIDNPCGEAIGAKPVRIDLDSSFDFSLAAADGHDLRASLDDEVSEIPLWIEHWDASAGTATVWVRLPDLPLAGRTIYLYSGYENAETISRAASVFDLFDGFETDNLGEVAAGQRVSLGQWNRKGAGAAFEPGPPTSWDAAGVRFGSVIWDTDELEYRAYYEGISEAGESQIGVAFSPDGDRWTRWRDGAVLSPTPGAWDSDGLFSPVVWREASADYRMIYTGAGPAGRQVGYATSSDGLTWTKSADNPVFSDETWAAGDTNNGGVIRVGSEYLLWYSTRGAGQSGLAVSTDLVHWSAREENPLFLSSGVSSDRTYSQMATQTFRRGTDFYAFVIASDGSAAHGEVDLYRSSSPYFPTADRTLVRTVHLPGAEGEWDARHTGWMGVVTTGIDGLDLHAGELRAYYAAQDASTLWRGGQLHEPDLEAALVDAAPSRSSLSWSFTAEVSVSAPNAHQGSRAVLLADESSDHEQEARASFDGLPSGRVAAWMQRDGSSNGDFDLQLFEGNTLAAAAGFGADGYFHFWAGSDISTSIPWSSGRWYLVELFFDTLMGTYDVTVFDETLTELGSFSDVGFAAPVARVDGASLWTSGGLVENAFFDDFRVEKDCGADPGSVLGAQQSQPEFPFTVTVLEVPEGYYQDTVSLAPENKYTYFDRSYIFEAAPPELIGLPYISTAVRDDLADAEEWITIHVNRPARVYVGYSNAQVAKPPNWLNHHYLEDGLEVSRTFWTWQVWERDFPAGRIVLGSNAAAGTVEGHITNYTVIIEELVKP